MEEAVWAHGDQRGSPAQGAVAGEQRVKEDAGRVAAEEPGFGGHMRKKVVSPAHRRTLAQEAVDTGLCSQRAACRILGLARSTYGYRGRPATAREELLRQRLLALSAEHPRYGYRRIVALLRREGCNVGKRQIQRLRRDEGLRVPPSKRKLARRGVSTGLPTLATHRNHVWTGTLLRTRLCGAGRCGC